VLVDRGADLKAAGGPALAGAAAGKCQACIDLLIAAAGKPDLTHALVALAQRGDTALLARLIDSGADVNGRLSQARRDIRLRTPLMLAASSDLVHADTIRMLLARGADIQAIGPEGETALDLARRNWDTDVVRVLVEAGARTGRGFPTASPTPRPASSPRAAFERIMPLLQQSDVTFVEKTGCVSCHHNTLTAMTVAAARAQRLAFDDGIAARQRESVAARLGERRENAALGAEIQNTASNILTGLAAERYPPDVTTDVMAYFLKGRQSADGRWRSFYVDHRPPVQHSDIEATATAVRALRVYAPMPRRSEYEHAVRRATAWLLAARPRTVDERAWQLMGLAWAGVDTRHDRIQAAAKSLLAEQRPDGGWAQLPTLASDAYATGQVLVALRQVGAVRSSEAAYRRAVEYLLGSQLADGTWHVKSRAMAFQPYFESGFPHGPDQWVSMAASNWAAMALAAAAEEGQTRAFRPAGSGRPSSHR
jgi:Squalene-hopene cyclase C-terminal domain/Ankyrin repeats (3 copies)/Prenyltransferase and squalene oxidase repeat